MLLGLFKRLPLNIQIKIGFEMRIDNYNSVTCAFPSSVHSCGAPSDPFILMTAET